MEMLLTRNNLITQTLFPLNYTVISKSGGAQLDLLILDTIYKKGSHNNHLYFSQKASFLPTSHNQPKEIPVSAPPNIKVTSRFPNAFFSGPFTKYKLE
ncbi:hypothetical protein YC2023_018049 [Brassica napus]